eukprot:1156039-Pelagomonas_calceolata.AAC.5
MGGSAVFVVQNAMIATCHAGQHPQGPDPTYPVSHDGDSHSLGSADGTKVVDGIDGPLLMTGTPSQRGVRTCEMGLQMKDGISEMAWMGRC